MTVAYVDEPELLVTVGQQSVNAVIDSQEILGKVEKSEILVTVLQYDTGTVAVVEEDEVFDVESDFSVPGVYYIGQAPVGSLTSDAVWRIRKVTETPTGTSIDWANGTSEFIHIWDDRLTITYGP
jgi:hypothetical protein